ncbi:MAG: glycosyltransferase 87 family protein [Defluviitaleaceae bacterium]|nr:glycosyltransferase 87 family protein [Defluviitaleaceae bacterium]
MRIGNVKISNVEGYITLFFIGFALRFIAFSINMPFESDVRTFQAWAFLLHEYGLSNFYYADTFTDYPPMYMYVLWVLGFIRIALGIDFFSTQINLLFFMPAIISDVITTLLIYRLCRNIISDNNFGISFLIALAYSANPAVIINSAVWGQVDSIHTLLLFLALSGIVKKQTLPIYLLYGIAVLTKPQSLIVAPVFLYSAFHYFKENEYSPKSAATMVGYAALTFLFMALLSLPFVHGFDLTPVLRQYFDTMGTYPFASHNAYNFYALTGGNRQAITLFYVVVSVVAIVGVTIMSFWILHHNWSEKSALFVAGLLFTITFVFSVRMHERYLFPALLFFLAAAIYNEKDKQKIIGKTRRKSKHKSKQKDIRLFILYGAFSVTLFINCADVLLQFHGMRFLTLGEASTGAFRPIDEGIALVSFINVVLAIYSLKIGLDIKKCTKT